MLVIAVACWVAITVCTIVVCLALDTRMNWVLHRWSHQILWGAISHDHHRRAARGARHHPAQAPNGDVATTRGADACVVEPPAIAPAPPPNLHSAPETRRSDRHRPRIDKQAHYRVSAASASRIFWMAGSLERFIVSECCRARVVLLQHVEPPSSLDADCKATQKNAVSTRHKHRTQEGCRPGSARSCVEVRAILSRLAAPENSSSPR
jgi:hypothetical protein